MTDPTPTPNTPSVLEHAALGLCPRCAARTLFTGPVRFTARCSACDLDLDQFNVGDGPAAFLVMIVGAIVTIGAISLELGMHPPFWVHILLWVPITAALVVGLLRIAKGVLLVLEYRNRAREGRVSID